MDSSHDNAFFHSETSRPVDIGMTRAETVIAATDRDGPAVDSGEIEDIASSCPMRPSSPFKNTGCGNIREYLETSMEEYLDAEMEITETIKPGLLESSPQRNVFYPNANESPQEEVETPVSFTDSTESTLPPHDPPTVSVEPDLDRVLYAQDVTLDDPSDVPFRESIDPLPSEETMDQTISTLEEADESLERKRPLESVEPSSDEAREELSSDPVETAESATPVDEFLLDKTAPTADIPLLEVAAEVVFLGNIESPHSEPEALDVPFSGSKTSTSGGDVLLDEDILNLSPTELELLLQQMKAASIRTTSPLDENGQGVVDTVFEDDVVPKIIDAPVNFDDILDTEMTNEPALEVIESREVNVPNDMENCDTLVETNVHTIDEPHDEISPDVPEDKDFRVDATDEELIEYVFLEEVEIAEVSDDALAVSPEAVLEAVKEFTSVVPTSLETTGDSQNGFMDECLDGSQEVILKEDDTCSLQTTSADNDASIPEKESFAICEHESIGANAETTAPFSQAPPAQIHSESINVEVFNANVFDDKPQEADRFEVFEKVWSEPNTAGDSMTNNEYRNDSNIATPDECLAFNTDHLKSPVYRDASGSTEILNTRKGSAYVEHAKRSVQKFNQMKEELLKEEQKEAAHVEYVKRSAMKLQQAKNELLNGEDFVGEKIADAFTVNKAEAKKDIADGVGIVLGTKPLSTPENEIVRVPTSEEMKPAVKSPDSATTSCLGTCAIM